MKRTLLLVLALVALLPTACGQAPIPRAGQPTTVVIAMGYVPNVQFTPVYVSLERGYFRDEGLDVQLDYGMETDLIQRVGTNQLQFAIGSGDQVILARANDVPVVYVLNWYRRFPVCVVSMASKGIDEPRKLAGKTVGISHAAGASYIGWQAFLEQVGMSTKDVTLQVIGYTQVASLVENRVDAAVCYAMNEPIQLMQSGYKLNVFYLDRYTHLVSNGIITNDATIKKNPKLVQSVVRGFVRGLQDTINDPEGAFAVTRRAIPEMGDDAAKLQRAVLQECVAFWKGETLGASQPTDWEESVAFLRKVGLISTTIKPDSLYTNRFVASK